MVTDRHGRRVLPVELRRGLGRRSFRPYPVAPSFDLDDPQVHLVDLTGNGVTDAIRSGTRLDCFFSDPDAGWTRPALDRAGRPAPSSPTSRSPTRGSPGPT